MTFSTRTSEKKKTFPRLVESYRRWKCQSLFDEQVARARPAAGRTHIGDQRVREHDQCSVDSTIVYLRSGRICRKSLCSAVASHHLFATLQREGLSLPVSGLKPRVKTIEFFGTRGLISDVVLAWVGDGGELFVAGRVSSPSCLCAQRAPREPSSQVCIYQGVRACDTSRLSSAPNTEIVLLRCPGSLIRNRVAYCS